MKDETLDDDFEEEDNFKDDLPLNFYIGRIYDDLQNLKRSREFRNPQLIPTISKSLKSNTELLINKIIPYQ